VWDWCRDVSGIDCYLVQYFFTFRSQYAISPDTDSGSQPSRLLDSPTGQASAEITLVCLASVRGTVQSSHAIQPHVPSLILTDTQPLWHLSATILNVTNIHRQKRTLSNLLACPRNWSQNMRVNYPTARFWSASSHMVCAQLFPDRPNPMSCKSAQVGSCPITLLWLLPATMNNIACSH